MGIWDKARAAASAAKDMAADAASAKLEEAKGQQLARQEAKAAEKAAQDEMATTFSRTRSFGRIEVDHGNGLLKVVGPVQELPKQEGGLVKGARAIGAIYTLGASLAVESALKNKPFYIPFQAVRGYAVIRDDEEAIGGGTFEAQTSSWGMGGAAGGLGIGFGSGKTRGRMSERQIKKSVSLLALRLDLKSFETPCIFVPYITDSTPVKSRAYTSALTDLQQACSALDIVTGMD